MSAAPGKSPDCSSQSTSAPHPRARIAPPGKAIANCHAGAAQAWRCTFSRGRRLFGPLRSGPNNPSSSRTRTLSWPGKSTGSASGGPSSPSSSQAECKVHREFAIRCIRSWTGSWTPAARSCESIRKRKGHQANPCKTKPNPCTSGRLHPPPLLSLVLLFSLCVFPSLSSLPFAVSPPCTF